MTADQLPAAALADGLLALGVEVPPAAQAGLLAYLALLAKWNRTYNLTAVRDPAAMVARHLLDSLAVLPLVHGASLADLGSGAGLPGIPLALARPGLAVTLIESNGKKARFLREAARSIPLPNVRITQMRVQETEGKFDTVTARAFASLADMLAWGGHLLAPGGRWLALKGRAPDAELAVVAQPFAVVRVHPLRVPGVAGERCVVEITRSRRANE